MREFIGDIVGNIGEYFFGIFFTSHSSEGIAYFEKYNSFRPFFDGFIRIVFHLERLSGF
jgi:hypothetical protein